MLIKKSNHERLKTLERLAPKLTSDLSDLTDEELDQMLVLIPRKSDGSITPKEEEYFKQVWNKAHRWIWPSEPPLIEKQMRRGRSQW